MNAFKRRMWEIMEGTLPDDKAARIFSVFISSLIILNIIALMAETVASLRLQYESFLYYFELFSILVFTLEYGCRLFSCVSDTRYARPIQGRAKFAIRWLSVVDLVSVLPFYLPFLIVDMRFIRVLRLLRLVRIAKLGRYNKGLRLVANVFREKKEELVISTVIMLILLVFASSALYYCERSVQPDKFPDIPTSMWWAVSTITTVGYGDIYPITVMGKIFAACVSIMGIGMFALPTAILGAGFEEEIRKRRQVKAICPHCGKELDCATDTMSREPTEEP